MSQLIDFDDEWAEPPQWAAMYRACGLQVVPAKTPREDPTNFKRPIISWREFEDEPTPQAVHDRWYDAKEGEHRTRRNMGLIMGRASGGVFCVDLDLHKDNSQARTWWADLLAENAHGVEPATVAQRTGGGGRQLLFKAPAGWSPPTFKTPIGIDIRGQGGFMMAPPSMHSSGKAYDWEKGRAPWQSVIADAPEWLIDAIETLREQHGGAPTGSRERTHTPAEQNAFGLDIDGREEKLRNMVWAAVVDLYRDCPIPPGQEEQDAEKTRLWLQYSATTKSRLVRPGVDNADLLESEGRGWSELVRKWRHAMRKWDTDVRAAAAVEKAPRVPAPAPTIADLPAHDPETGEIVEQQPAEDADDEPFSAATLTGEPPPRRWLWDQWIPEGVVTSLYGDGGLGKTLLMQQFASAASIGGRFMGHEIPKCRVLAVLCEDEKDELHRRQNHIKAATGHTMGSPFADLWLWPRLGRDNTLTRWNKDGEPVLTDFAKKLTDRLDRCEPDLLILDTLADFYGGNEIDRVQVNYFVKTVLGGFIERRKRLGKPLTVVLLGHPSVAGKSTGSGYSGSTAWNAAVRSRMYLSRPEEGGSDERILTRGKANYAKSGDETAIRLFYADGVLHACDDAEDGDSLLWACREEVCKLVDRAWSSGQPYSGQKGHKREVYAALPMALQGAGFSPQITRQAIREAIEDGLIALGRDNAKRGYRASKNAR